jgi:hypothetical protein
LEGAALNLFVQTFMLKNWWKHDHPLKISSLKLSAMHINQNLADMENSTARELMLRYFETGYGVVPLLVYLVENQSKPLPCLKPFILTVIK